MSIFVISSIGQAANFKTVHLNRKDLATATKLLKKERASGDIDEDQSFKISSAQKGLENHYLVNSASTDPNKPGFNSFIIDLKTSKVVKLPDHPVLEDSLPELVAVAFRDVQDHGDRAIVIDAKATVGVGPDSGSEFHVFGIYLPTENGGWSIDHDLQRYISGKESLDSVVKSAAAYFEKKK